MAAPWAAVNSTGRNASGPALAPPPPALRVALPVAYAAICTLGLAGNAAVAFVTLRAPGPRTATHVFVLNLAAADGLFALVLPASIAEHLLQRWPFGDLLCKLALAADRCNIFSSAYFLVAMGADRYRAVLAATRARPARRSPRAAKLACLGVWLAVGVAVLPFLAFAGVDGAERPAPRCGLSFPPPEQAWVRASRLYTLLLGFAAPMSLLCALYADLLRRLRAPGPRPGAKALGRARRKATVLVLAVLAVGLFCWTPFHLASLVALTTDLPPTPLVVSISYAITGLSYTSSCLNPLLYACLDDAFRKNVHAAFRCQGP